MIFIKAIFLTLSLLLTSNLWTQVAGSSSDKGLKENTRTIESAIKKLEKDPTFMPSRFHYSEWSLLDLQSKYLKRRAAAITLEDMIPLQGYMDRILDYSDWFYVYSRCSAINYKANELSESTDEYEDLLTGFSLEAIDRFNKEAIFSRSQIIKAAALQHQQSADIIIKLLVDKYTSISNQYYLKKESYLPDMLVEDLTTCILLLEVMGEPTWNK